MTMSQRHSNILRSYVRGPRVPRLREAREAVDGPIAMLESSQPPGSFETPAVSDLVLSQSVGRPFRYTCNLGAGRFSGQTRPMDFVAVAPDVAPWCAVPEPAQLRFIGIPAELARACLERDSDDPLDFGPIHTRPRCSRIQAWSGPWNVPSRPSRRCLEVSSKDPERPRSGLGFPPAQALATQGCGGGR